MPNAQNDNILQFLNPGALPWALLLLTCTVVLVRVLERLVLPLSERFGGQRLLIRQLSTVFSFLLYAASGAVVFSMVFNLSPQALLAISGTVAVTLGFAFKDVVASFMAGLSILLNKPFQVGDRISFGGFYGEVREIGLRTVRLVTLDDNLVTIPSNKFLTDPVASANAGQLDCMVVMPFYITPGADHVRARHLVRDAVLASKYVYLGKPLTVLLANRLTDEGKVVVELTAKAYVFDTRYEKAFASDVTDRVLTAFRASDIAVPA